MSGDTINLIRDITLHYIKHYYEKYLKDHHITIIPEQELSELVESLYVEKQKELRKYIRENMKSNQGAAYNTILVENALEEMFSDKDYGIRRVIMEITNYQNTSTHLNGK
jgi:hypothetical protein